LTEEILTPGRALPPGQGSGLPSRAWGCCRGGVGGDGASSNSP